MTKRALIAGTTGTGSIRLLEAVRLSGIQIHRYTAMPIGRALAWIKRVINLPDIPVVLSSVNTVAVQRPA